MEKNRFRCKFKQNKQKESTIYIYTFGVCDKIHCTLVAGCANKNTTDDEFRLEPTHTMPAHFWHSCFPLESCMYNRLLSFLFEHFRFLGFCVPFFLPLLSCEFQFHKWLSVQQQNCSRCSGEKHCREMCNTKISYHVFGVQHFRSIGKMINLWQDVFVYARVQLFPFAVCLRTVIFYSTKKNVMAIRNATQLIETFYNSCRNHTRTHTILHWQNVRSHVPCVCVCVRLECKSATRDETTHYTCDITVPVISQRSLSTIYHKMWYFMRAAIFTSLTGTKYMPH